MYIETFEKKRQSLYLKKTNCSKFWKYCHSMVKHDNKSHNVVCRKCEKKDINPVWKIREKMTCRKNT